MAQGIVASIAVLAALSPVPALAGAWTLKTGEGQVIVSGLYSEALELFDDQGDPQAIPVFHKAELSAHAEYGLTDWLTAIGRSELKTEAVGTPVSIDAARFGLSGVGLRARLWQGDGTVVSAELSGRMPVGSRRFDHEPDAEVDLRMLAGLGFALGSWSGFVDLQGAYRLRPGAPADEIRADLTLGLRPRSHLLWLAQSFNTLSTDGEELASSTEHKAAVSLVYDMTTYLSVQVGGIATVAGRDALRERGLITALWLRF